MLELNAISLKEIPYKVEYFVGTILFSEYPTTMVYSNENKDVVIKEWVDCSDDNTINRYFFYRTDKVNLKKFIEGLITHIDLINSSFEDYVIFQDIVNGVASNTLLMSISGIPPSYKPQTDFSIDIEEGVNIPEIYEYFGLDEIDVGQKDSELKKVSQKNNTETIYIHLNQRTE